MKEQKIKGTLTQQPTCNCGTETQDILSKPPTIREETEKFFSDDFNGLLGKESCAHTVKVSLKMSCSKWVNLWSLLYLSHYGPLGNIVLIVNKLFYLFMYFIKQFGFFFVFIPQGQLEWHREGERESGEGEMQQQAQAEIQTWLLW